MIDGPSDIVAALNVLRSQCRELEESLARKIQDEIDAFEAVSGVCVEGLSIHLVDVRTFSDARPKIIVAKVDCLVKLWGVMG